MLGTFLKVNQNTIAYDYGQGYYVSEPKDLRSESKVSSVEIMKQMQTKIMKKKQKGSGADDELTNAQETKQNTMLNSTKFSNMNPSTNRSGHISASETDRSLVTSAQANGMGLDIIDEDSLDDEQLE